MESGLEVCGSRAARKGSQDGLQCWASRAPHSSHGRDARAAAFLSCTRGQRFTKSYRGGTWGELLSAAERLLTTRLILLIVGTG